MFHIHRWGKWQDVGESSVLRNSKLVAFVFVQKRYCEKCNKMQIKTYKIKANA